MQTPESVQRLRRFILDLAVRGKLVPQDSADEPAFISSIEKKQRKSQQALPADIPGWLVAPVGALLEFRYGKGMKASERLIEGPVPVFGSNGIVGYCETPLTKTPSIIIGRKGSAGALNLCDGPSWTTDVAYFVEAPDFFDLHYLLIGLQTLDLGSLGKGVKPGLSRSDAYNLPLSVPPLVEQHRIVAKVDELMGLCDRLEAAQMERETTRTRLAAASLARLNAPDPDQATFREHVAFVLNNLAPMTTRPEQVKALRQTILNLAVRGKLVEQNPGDEPAAELLKRIAAEKAQLARRGRIRQAKPLPSIDPGSLLFVEPLGWTWAHLLEISRKIHYGFTASAIKENNNVRLLRITDIRNNKVDWNGVPGCEIDEETLPNFKLETGDILIARTGGTIGKSFLVTKLPHVSVFASYLIRVQSSKEICVRYLKLFLESPVYWSQLQTGARGAGQPNINGRTLGKILVSLPPLPEQHRIVTKVNELMALCDRLEGSLEDGDDGRGRLLDTMLHEALEPDGNRRESSANLPDLSR